jgi:hypothetical protein
VTDDHFFIKVIQQYELCTNSLCMFYCGPHVRIQFRELVCRIISPLVILMPKQAQTKFTSNFTAQVFGLFVGRYCGLH